MTVSQIPKVPRKPTVEFLYTSRIEVDPALVVGQSPYGERRIINIKGGGFSGPKLSGRVLQGGADWQIIRHGPKAVIGRLASGENVDPGEYYFRTTPIFETGAADYAWLNRIVAIATGQRRADEAIITVYEVT